MHDCPRCGFACDCDGEDTWSDAAEAECLCNCEDALQEDGDYEELEGDYDYIEPGDYPVKPVPDE